MSPPLRRLLAAFAWPLLCGPVVAAGPAVPWADPIGASAPLGTSPGVPSVPHAQPIGASRLNPPPVARTRPAPGRPAQRCYRVAGAGRVVVRCAPPG